VCATTENICLWEITSAEKVRFGLMEMKGLQ